VEQWQPQLAILDKQEPQQHRSCMRLDTPFIATMQLPEAGAAPGQPPNPGCHAVFTRDSSSPADAWDLAGVFDKDDMKRMAAAAPSEEEAGDMLLEELAQFELAVKLLRAAIDIAAADNIDEASPAFAPYLEAKAVDWAHGCYDLVLTMMVNVWVRLRKDAKVVVAPRLNQRALAMAPLMARQAHPHFPQY